MRPSAFHEHPSAIILTDINNSVPHAPSPQGAPHALSLTNEHEFIKTTILTYPHIDPQIRFILVVSPEYPKAYKLATSMCKCFTNVSHFSSIPDLKSINFDIDILKETANKLKKYGVDSLLSNGFVFEQSPHYQVDLLKDLGITSERLDELGLCADDWSLNVHDYTSNELVALLYLIFKKLVADPEVTFKVNIPDSNLLWFVCVCRLFYRTNVPYHSFFHCADVTQFAYLTLSKSNPWNLNPLQKFATVLAATGHDVLHPGISGPLVAIIDPQMKENFTSLEAYHVHVYNKLLKQLLPETHSLWVCVQDAIAATNLEHHKALISQSPTYVHVLKMSDFACTIRPGFKPHEITSVSIFLEFSNQHDICRMLNIDSDRLFPLPNSDLSDLERIIDIQIRFISKMVIPYFEYLSIHFPPYKVYENFAKAKLAKYEHLRNIKTSGSYFPYVVPPSCYAASPGKEFS